MTPYPGTKDGSLPTHFQNVFDPFELLTFVAANTQKISLGTAVIDMFYHNPVILARAFATRAIELRDADLLLTIIIVLQFPFLLA